MNILIGSLIVLEILVSILLTLVILVQPSKGGGGLGGALGGGGMGEQLFGARTGNVLTKATVILATVFLVNTMGLAFLYSRQDPLRTTVTPGPGIESMDGETEGTDLPPVEGEVPEAGPMEEIPEPETAE